MKIGEVFKGSKSEINLDIKPAIKGELFKSFALQFVEVTYSQNAYWLVTNGDRTEVEGLTPKDNDKLDGIAQGKSITIAIESIGSEASLKSKLLSGIISIPEGIEIGLTDIIIDDLEKRFFNKIRKRKEKSKSDRLIGWLTDQLIIEGSDKQKVLIDNVPVDKAQGKSGFRIFGKSIAIDTQENEDSKFEIKRILKWNNQFNPTYMISGEISIKDISKVGVLRKNIQLQLNKISSNERYIKTWENYQKKEKEGCVKEVEKRGFLTITQIKRKGIEKYKLTFQQDENTANWLKIDRGAYIDLNLKRVFPDFDSYNDKNKAKITCKIIAKEDDYLLVESENEISIGSISNYYACLSLLGNVIMNSRRTNTLDKIRNNDTPMPVLSAVLEGVDYGSVQRRKIKPLTSRTKRKFGTNGPNEMQELALDIALNSPDITIIQGPPGTGKTKVISALATRLVEEYKDNGERSEMNILLTAFQHDAVENMVSRTEVLGLPAINFTNRKNQSIDILDRWIGKQSEKIKALQSKLEPNELELTYNKLVASYLSYLETLNDEQAIACLNKIRKEKIALLPDDILAKYSHLLSKAVGTNDKIKEKILSLVSSIRTDVISYEDDGEANLRRFLKNYANYKQDLSVISVELIKDLKNILETKCLFPAQLKILEARKLELLDLLKSGDINKRIQLPNSEIESLFKKLIAFFSSQLKSNGSIYSVLDEYQYDLNANKDRVRETIQNYVALVASTVQGSKAKQLTTIKSTPFDTVIVDEAARANPLDLLIPLTSAERRIVLVGDHRQLPHIVDAAIEKELEDDPLSGENVSQFLKDSLFERFYKTLKKLQKKDGIQRVVTLNLQYRMHPKIGDFISRTFYEQYGDPKINSGTSAEKLTHNILEYKDKVAVSINIPNIKGNEKKQSGSIFRSVEAKEAIRRAKKILDLDPSLSVGVITFYSRQVTELYLEAQKSGMAIKDDNGNYVITKPYQKTMNAEERFRIGSVDAFQGKEFDVVILSLVRSNRITIKVAKDVRNKYGFLTSYNRLNVAMSRAKKLLMVIGDEEMFKIDEAKTHVFGLYAFYNELIKSDYGLSI